MSVEPEQIMPTYSGFLIGQLNKISQAWDDGDAFSALMRTIKLVYFLPTDFKKVLFPKVEAIENELNKARSINGHDFYTNQLRRNRALTQIAGQRLPTFLDEVVELLDKRGYLEKRRREVPEGKE